MNRKQRRAMRMQGQGVGADTGRTSQEAAGRLFSQSVWHQHHGKPNEAVKLYKQVLALKADHAEAHNNLGCVLLAQGKRDAASACFERALVLVPQLFDDFASLSALLVAVNPALGEGMTRAAGAWPRRVARPPVPMRGCVECSNPSRFATSSWNGYSRPFAWMSLGWRAMPPRATECTTTSLVFAARWRNSASSMNTCSRPRRRRPGRQND